MGKGIHLYQMTYWEQNGFYYCNDVKNLVGKSAKWYTAMRILNLSVEEYINLLINTFHAAGIKYFKDTDCLVFHFKVEKDVKAFCSYVNKKAKALNYYCK